MSHQLWRSVIKSKFFYVYTYRRAGSYLLVSGLLNVLLLLGVAYSHFSQPEREFYATSGVALPIQLTPLLHPNSSAEPLLPEESQEDNTTRPIPN